MSDYPKPILDYIYEITIANRSLAYLLVGEDGYNGRGFSDQ